MYKLILHTPDQIQSPKIKENTIYITCFSIKAIQCITEARSSFELVLPNISQHMKIL
jgi:hypothetical protein